MIELLSIDLSNYCSKQCPFCYNHSTREGNTLWQPQEVIAFAADCIRNGVKAVSLGGGEPFEYEGVFDVIDALYPLCYLSVTTNGLPLEKEDVWNPQEVERVMNLVQRIAGIGIKPGVNLLVGADKIDKASTVYQQLAQILTPDQIILVPQRFSNTPTAKQLAAVADGKPFQSPSCLLECRPPQNFCSVSWDKKAAPCSFAPCKEPLPSLDFAGLVASLKNVRWKSCFMEK